VTHGIYGQAHFLLINLRPMFVLMKFIATILICYFCVLIVQPLYHMGGATAKSSKCGTEMCCKKMAHKTPVKPCGSASCNTDFCNPFVPCGISIASRVVEFKFGNPIFELSSIKKPAVNDHIISNYLSDCWRPPRLC
jgi:hypothetical protein